MIRHGQQNRTEQRQLQKFQQAIWNTFLLHEPPRKGFDLITEFRRGVALADLEDVAHDARRHPFIGIAVWNLLPYMADGGPKGFKELVKQVLALDFDHALNLRRERVEALPPFPDPRIGDSRWTDFSFRENAWNVTLEMCVVKSFERFRRPPETWFGAPFWRRREGRIRGRDSRQVTYSVRLPEGAQPTSKATLTVSSLVSNDLQRAVTFSVSDARFKKFDGTVTIEKEKGQPGATRIKQSRRIEFANGTMRERHRPALTYWLQADALCLAHN